MLHARLCYPRTPLTYPPMPLSYPPPPLSYPVTPLSYICAPSPLQPQVQERVVDILKDISDVKKDQKVRTILQVYFYICTTCTIPHVPHLDIYHMYRTH